LGNGVVRPKPSGLVASPSWARPSVVAGGSTCALDRALVQAGIEAKSARAVSSLLVRTAGDGDCSARLQRGVVVARSRSATDRTGQTSIRVQQPTLTAS
jgi:hypothetical protein